MIQEAYCSYEISRLLKEKGFNEKTFTFYIKGQPYNLQHNFRGNKFSNSEMENAHSSPTHQMAMAWLREEKKIYIRIIEDAFGENYHFEIYSKNPNIKMNYYVPNYYESTYEDAVEAAIKYCLENLI